MAAWISNHIVIKCGMKLFIHSRLQRCNSDNILPMNMNVIFVYAYGTLSSCSLVWRSRVGEKKSLWYSLSYSQWWPLGLRDSTFRICLEPAVSDLWSDNIFFIFIWICGSLYLWTQAVLWRSCGTSVQLMWITTINLLHAAWDESWYIKAWSTQKTLLNAFKCIFVKEIV